MQATGSNLLRKASLSALGVVAIFGPPLIGEVPDGTYEGVTEQGEAISLVVEDGDVRSYSVGYNCPSFSATVTVNLAAGNCPIVDDSFDCGATFCAPFLSTRRLSGTFAGEVVAGDLDVQHQSSTLASCCSLSGVVWAGIRADIFADGFESGDTTAWGAAP